MQLRHILTPKALLRSCPIAILIMISIHSNANSAERPPEKPNHIESNKRISTIIIEQLYLNKICNLGSDLPQAVAEYFATQKEFDPYADENRSRALNGADLMVSSTKGLERAKDYVTYCVVNKSETKDNVSFAVENLKSATERVKLEQNSYTSAYNSWKKRIQLTERASIYAEKLGRYVAREAYQGVSAVSISLTNSEVSTYGSFDKYTLVVEMKWKGELTGNYYQTRGVITAIDDDSSKWAIGKNVGWEPLWESQSLKEYRAMTNIGNAAINLLSR